MRNLIMKSLQIVILLTVHNVYGIDLLVETNLGRIRGLQATDGDYSMFMGIPYAMVNEANPFGLATPYGPFNKTFEAYDDSAICPQVEQFNNTIIRSLDCLHLNVYVPNSAPRENPLPVLVWIFGGGFSFRIAGRFIYGPKYLVRHQIILVTINYRLDPYGFMCTPEMPGNQGLKDQVLALRWIKDNIAAFGNDDSKITLYGASAGGISIDFHLHSSQEKLFNNLILQSGTAYVPEVINEGSEERTLKLASKLGFVTDNLYEAVSFLATIDSDLVISAASQINGGFQPCIEKGDSADKFMPEHPINTDIPKIQDTGILIGHTDDEMVTKFAHRDADFYSGLNLFFYNTLNSGFNLDADELNDLEDSVRHFYIGDENFTEKFRDQLTNFYSDWKFIHPTQRSINKYVDSGANNIFYYVFRYTGGRDYLKQQLNVTVGSAAHADEIGYLFDVSYMRDVPSNEDQIIIDRMTTMWANFVKDPTSFTTNLLPVKWKPVKKDALNYLTIDTNFSVGTRPFKERLAFWDLIYYYCTKKIKH